MTSSITINLPDETATLAMGARLAELCPQPFVIYLHGELGAGKTTLVRGFLRGLGHNTSVKSPTYTLVEPYEIAGRQIFHFDLYRINDPQEIAAIGIRDYFSPTSICLIEWPERAKNVLPNADLTCYIRSLASGRQLEMTAGSVAGNTLLKNC